MLIDVLVPFLSSPASLSRLLFLSPALCLEIDVARPCVLFRLKDNFKFGNLSWIEYCSPLFISFSFSFRPIRVKATPNVLHSLPLNYDPAKLAVYVERSSRLFFFLNVSLLKSA